jgi:hypothetical protein
MGSILDSLDSRNRELVERIAAEHGDAIRKAAFLKILLEKGFESAFLARYFQHRLGADLEDFHVRLINTALYESRGLVLFPAGHGKTTLIGGLLPILDICRNPNIRIAGIFKNDDEAAGVIMTIKAEFENNELLIQDYGPFKPASDDSAHPWKADWISVAKRTLIAKEPTIAVFGSGAKNILGHRTDWVICDDVVTEKNSATPEQREKMSTWFKECVETSGEKLTRGQVGGRITVVGTMFHPKDLYHAITQKKDRLGRPRYKHHREDAIRSVADQLPLWPARWTWEDLMDEKASLGTLSFNKRFRNRPVDESEQPFREAWLRGEGDNPGCLDTERCIWETEDHWRVYIQIDPAVGKSKSAKFCGLTVAAVDPDLPKNRYLVYADRQQLTLPQQVQWVVNTWQSMPNALVAITEENAYQAGLGQAIMDYCDERGISINLQGHTTGRNKADPEIGIHSMSSMFENGYARLPYGDAESRRLTEQFMEELIEYPFFLYSDMLMSWWFFHLASKDGIINFKSHNYLSRKSQYRRSGRVRKNPWHNRRQNRVVELDQVPDQQPDHSSAELAALKARYGDRYEELAAGLKHLGELDIPPEDNARALAAMVEAVRSDHAV